MRGHMVEVAGTELYVRRWGPPGGRPLLFLHALGPAASAALLDVGVKPLAEAGYAIAAPDMPGFGQSPPVPAEQYAVPALVGLVPGLADALGWERFVLGGHSWGGAIAVHAAAAHPDRVQALVLVDSGHLDYADTPGADLASSLEELTAQAEANRRRAADRADLAAGFDLPVDDPLVDALMEGMTDDGEEGLIARAPGSTRAAAMYFLARSRQSEQWPAIARAAIPTLLLLATVPDEARAANDTAAARFIAGIPRADVRFVEGASHSLITDGRDRFGTTVLDWLTSLDT